jgi:capsule polysaccharide export protein KpsE/RkpR
VVNAIGSDVIVRGPASGDATGDAGHQEAVRKLQQNISIFLPESSSTITVTGNAETPQLAQRIVATLVGLYLEEYKGVHDTPGSFESLGNEHELLNKQRSDASARLREAQQRFGVATPAGKRKVLEDQIADVDSQLLHELFKYEAEERRLSAQLAEDHPQIRAIRGVIDSLMQVIQDPDAAGPMNSEVPSLLPDRTTPPSLNNLRTQRQQLRLQLAELNEHDSLLSQLERDAELAEGRLKSHAETAEQGRIKERLDQETLTRLSIVQPASYPTESTGPRPSYVLPIGAFVGLLGGMGLALLCYYADPLLKTCVGLERMMISSVETAGRLPAVSTGIVASVSAAIASNPAKPAGATLPRGLSLSSRSVSQHTLCPLLSWAPAARRQTPTTRARGLRVAEFRYCENDQPQPRLLTPLKAAKW